MRLLACVSVVVCVSLLLLGRSGAKEMQCWDGWVGCSGTSEMCVPKSSLCNGIVDCDNGVDESWRCIDKCVGESFQCDGRCVHNDHKCDGVAWCRDGTDEANCSSIKSKPACPVSTRCNGIWDGPAGCVTGDDELDCIPEQCQAPATPASWTAGWCVDPDSRCNGVKNYVDSTDELECTQCNGGAVMCHGRCLPAGEVCKVI